ncbi:hypothetical protein I317_07550 [Kwoniella heveanensis CBS 569]|nr:hypothetical protein I317_07550 [Kwoniella heveanensis CBS 569]
MSIGLGAYTSFLSSSLSQRKNPARARRICSTCRVLSRRALKPGESSTSGSIPRLDSTPRLERAHDNQSSRAVWNHRSSTIDTPNDKAYPTKRGPVRNTARNGSSASYAEVAEGKKPMLRASKRSILSGLGIDTGKVKDRATSTFDISSKTISSTRQERPHFAQRGIDISRREQAAANTVGSASDSRLEGLYGVRSDRPGRQHVRASAVESLDRTTFRSRQSAEGDGVSTSVSSPASQFDDSRVHFIGIDLESALSKIYGHKLPVYRCPSFNIRAYPSAFLPPRRSTPFPPCRNMEYRRERLCVYLGLMSSKSAVSKLAVERNRCRRRVKTALDEVVNGVEDLGGLSKDQRMKLVTPEYAYIISLTAESHDAVYDTLKSDILKSLQYLKNAQPRKWNEGSRLPLPKYIPRTQFVYPAEEAFAAL